MIYEYRFLVSLVLTIAIETIVLFLIARSIFKLDKSHIKDRILIFAGFFSSFATLPYLWFIFPLIIRSYYLLNVFGELSVFLIESIIYYFVLKISINRALLLSFICNITSFLLGLLFSYVF